MFHKNRFSSALDAALLAAVVGLGLAAPPPARAAAGDVTLPGHVPHAAQGARVLGPVDPAKPVSLLLSLPLRHQDQLGTLLGRLSDPRDPLYRHFLTPTEFADRFAPTPQEYGAVAAYVQSRGLTVAAASPTRTTLTVRGPAGAVQGLFRLHLRRMQSPDVAGEFFAPDADPTLPAALAGHVLSVLGLDNVPVVRPGVVPAGPRAPYRPTPASTDGLGSVRSESTSSSLAPSLSGDSPPLPGVSGADPVPWGAGVFSPDFFPNFTSFSLTPVGIAQAYNLTGYAHKAASQTLALVELDGFKASAPQAYSTRFGLPASQITTYLVDGFTGAPQTRGGETEVELDIEMMLALTSGGSTISVYEAPNSAAPFVDLFQRVANDDTASTVSLSWAGLEPASQTSETQSLDQVFEQLAAQGQSVFVAAGDSGAFSDGSTLSVLYPGSDPYVCGVGGTTLSVGPANSSGSTYLGESSWGNPATPSGGGGGGGISSIWPLPSYQQGFVSASSLGSTTQRNIPDVSLDANPDTGYYIYSAPYGWTVVGGTSAAAPLWAAFTALVDQQIAGPPAGRVGLPNPDLYRIAATARYGSDFHDISDGSDNLYYPAVAGYDLSTGLGSFNGANLLGDLVALAALNPAPSVISLSPASAATGSPALTLTVNGTGFYGGTTVTFGRTPLTPTVVSASQLTVTVPASLLATAGTFPVTVTDPATVTGPVPDGGSASAPFTVGTVAPPTGVIAAAPVYNDLNGNGQQDAGEPGLPGVTVYATTVNDTRTAPQAGDVSTTTGANGNYSLAVPITGQTYYIRVVVPSGYARTEPAPIYSGYLSTPADYSAGLTYAPFGLHQTAASISGAVTLTGWRGTKAPMPTITFVLTPAAGGSAITTTPVLTPTASAGVFTYTLPAVPAGAYTLGVKGPLWLREDMPGGVDTTGGNVTGANMTLPAGDATGDNRVDGADLSVLRAAYNTVLGGKNFNAAADLNGDGLVDSADLGLLRNSYNTVGAPF